MTFDGQGVLCEEYAVFIAKHSIGIERTTLPFGVALLLLPPASIEDWQSLNLATAAIALLTRFVRVGVWGETP